MVNLTSVHVLIVMKVPLLHNNNIIIIIIVYSCAARGGSYQACVYAQIDHTELAILAQ